MHYDGYFKKKHTHGINAMDAQPRVTPENDRRGNQGFSSWCTSRKLVLAGLIVVLVAGLLVAAGVWLGASLSGPSPTPIDATGPPPTTMDAPGPSPTTIAPGNPSENPTFTPSAFPTNIPSSYPTYIPLSPSNITVGVFYYPWHSNNFHNGQGYLRKFLLPRHQPALGEYNDRSTSVISQHLAWSRQANVRLWVTSWWGPDRMEDITTRDYILKHRELGEHRIALMYESSGRILPQGVFTTTNIAPDMEHICDTYFDHPNYYRVNGRPVLFVSVTRRLEDLGVLEETLTLMRNVAIGKGHNVFLVGDHAFQRPPRTEIHTPLFHLDAVTNYDMYGAMGSTGGFVGTAGVDAYFSDQRGWREAAHRHGISFIPCVSPGFNDRGVRLGVDHPPLPRKLNGATSAPGTLFRALLQGALFLVDPAMSNLVLVNSFNQWHEDTQIEPAVGIKASNPFTYTVGVEYEGYDERYLDILRDETQD